jgi:hypothetical protein
MVVAKQVTEYINEEVPGSGQWLTRTCPTCNGGGFLLFRRSVTTRWKYLERAVAHSPLHGIDLVSGCQQVTRVSSYWTGASFSDPVLTLDPGTPHEEWISAASLVTEHLTKLIPQLSKESPNYGKRVYASMVSVRVYSTACVGRGVL